MFQDEASFGRSSKLSHCWCPRGIRPRVKSQHIREYRYCFGAVDSVKGDTLFIISGHCNTQWTQYFLEELSKAYPNDYILLIMDNAVWHKAKALRVPHNIELLFIPPYCPEMNPIEQIWNTIRQEGFKNCFFHSLREVMDRLQETIHSLTKERVKSICHRDWISSAFNF